nr:hypothetical protein [uncultured bacterium]
MPLNPGYDELADLLVPAEWPPAPEVQAALANIISSRGMPALQAAVSSGQYRHPDGLFYGGNSASWSNLSLRQALRRYATQSRRLAWIDMHTGLGPSGVGERISASRDDATTLARARRWWGNAVTSIVEGSSSSARLEGLMWHAIEEECPQAEYAGIALEFGTVPLLQVLQALRADQWLQNHPDAPSQQAVAIKQQLRAAFYVETDEWQQQVLLQAAEAARQAVSGLSDRDA